MGRMFGAPMASVLTTMRQIRVLVVDDHGLMIEAVRIAMDREQDIEIVGEARSGREVLPEVARRQPDIVLLDIRMPDVDGLTVLRELRVRRPDVNVVMLSGLADPQIEREALRAGALAYLDKRVDPGTLAACLRNVMDGGAAATGTGCVPADEAAFPTLTEREREILVHVSRGKSNADIAAALWLSKQTIKYHLTNIYRKLGVKGRPGAVRYVFELGLANELERRPTG
jgi:DNA-binding NarL/FixJ family response regulator